MNTITPSTLDRLPDEAISQECKNSLALVVRDPPSPQVAWQRLTFAKATTMNFKLPKPDSKPPYPTSEAEFTETQLETVTLPVRVYTTELHPIEIVVPEEYARQLESVRALRTSSLVTLSANNGDTNQNAYAERLLPEDLPFYLDELPDSSYFSRVYLVDWDNPLDSWMSQKQGYNFVSAASVGDEEGAVFLYRTRKGTWLDTTLKHEWTHKLSNRYTELSKLFDIGISLEWRSYVPTSQAYVSYGEHAATFGESLLTDKFLQAAEQAPIRTALWMEMLNEALEAVPGNRRCVQHDRYMERVKWSRKYLRPYARQILRDCRKRAQVLYQNLA